MVWLNLEMIKSFGMLTSLGKISQSKINDMYCMKQNNIITQMFQLSCQNKH